MASPPCLQGVSKALAEWIEALPHVCDAVNLLAMPTSLDGVARSGRLELVRAYFDIIPSTPNAIAGGRLQVVQWVYTHLSGDKIKQSAWAVEAFKGAARGGQLAVLEWLISEFESSFEATEDAAVEAATHGWLAVVQWLMEEYDGAGDAGALTAAVMAGQRDVEEYLISICDDETCLDALGAALTAKAADNDTNRLEELSERCCELDVQEAMEDAIECDADEAVEVLWRSYHQGVQVDAYAIGLSVLKLSDALTRRSSTVEWMLLRFTSRQTA